MIQLGVSGLISGRFSCATSFKLIVWQLIVLLGFANYIRAETVDGTTPANAVFIPAVVAGGKVEFWSYSGQVVFVPNAWHSLHLGKVTLPLEWTDTKDPLHVFVGGWSFDLPEGQFVLGAERMDDEIVFTLTKVGASLPLLKSGRNRLEHRKWVLPPSSLQGTPSARPGVTTCTGFAGMIRSTGSMCWGIRTNGSG